MGLLGHHKQNDDQVQFNLKPLTLADLPPAGDTEAFTAWLDKYFAAGQKLAESMDEWNKSQKGELVIASLPNNSKSYLKSKQANVQLRKSIGVSEYWCGRISVHTPESILRDVEAPESLWNNLTRTLSGRRSIDAGTGRQQSLADRRPTVDLTEVERQDRVVNSKPHGLYEKLRLGLLKYHSENEREYIEACRESECIQVLQPHVAEIWRLTYVTPPPTSPRTFVVLVLSRELVSSPHGERCFMNISLPFDHPDVPEKQHDEAHRVRGRYVSVERVKELNDGAAVEWRTATSSDAGGNIPRFVTNASLPKSLAEDVPSFLKWAVKRWPPEGPQEGAEGFTTGATAPLQAVSSH